MKISNKKNIETIYIDITGLYEVNDDDGDADATYERFNEQIHVHKDDFRYKRTWNKFLNICLKLQKLCNKHTRNSLCLLTHKHSIEIDLLNFMDANTDAITFCAGEVHNNDTLFDAQVDNVVLI